VTGQDEDLSAEASAGAHAAADNPVGPILRVVRGEPTPEELAALVAVVAAHSAAAAATQEEPPRRLSAWTDRRQGMRQPVHVGPGAWVASGFTKGTRTRAAW
jgi:hypothetical protein